MVIANNCTKWVKAVPAQNLEATTAASKLVNLFWCSHRGSNFETIFFLSSKKCVQ